MSQKNFRTSSERPAATDRAAAIEVLNESSVIALDDEAWDDFVAALNDPIKIDPAVKARYARQPQRDR